VAFNPPPNDPQGTQKPSNATGAATNPAAKGRHDPACWREQCRMVEAMVLLVLADHCCASRFSAASGEGRAEARVRGS